MTLDLDSDAVKWALKRLISDIDYDLHKSIERDEETGEDYYPSLVQKFEGDYYFAAGSRIEGS